LYRLGVIDSFMGKLTLQDGTIVGAVLNLSEETLSVAAEGMTVGTWPLKYCRVSRLNEAEFVITVDGEPTTFQPVDSFRFAKTAAERFSASSLAERINVIRDMPLEPQVTITEPPSIEVAQAAPVTGSPRLPLAIAALVVAVSALIVISGLSTLQNPSETAVAPPEAERIEAVDEVLAEGPEIFTLTPEKFREVWNITAGALSADVALEGPFGEQGFKERISELIGFTGEVDVDGTVRSVKLDIIPTREGEESMRAVQAIEVAIAIAQPTITADERVRIIRDLGFELYPEQYGLAETLGGASGPGVAYELRFIDLRSDTEDLLVFSLWETGR
jgi:hypothetical protein